jgi:RNA polymerase sigma factor (sigma-70 family)
MTTREKYQYEQRLRLHETKMSKFTSPLSRSEQVALHGKIQQGDKNAKDTVITSCLPLVVNISQKFRVNNRHIDIEDFIQEGSIALMRAVDNWDINKASITTAASWYIKNRFIDLIHDAQYNVRYPYSLSRRAAEELRKVKSLDSNNIDFISEKTGLSKTRVKKLLRISPIGSRRVSLHCRDAGRIHSNEQEQEEATKKPCIGDLIELINNNLSGDQKTIFSMWSGVFKKKMGPKQIAKSLGKSEQYVYDNIYSAKRILSRIAKKARNNV